MTTPTAKTPFKLVPATPTDIDAIAQIAGDAFQTDSHTLMKAIWKGENNHQDGTRESLPDLLSNPKMDVIVARKGSDGTGEVIGSIIWVKIGYENQTPKTDNDSAEKPVPSTATTTTTAAFPPPPPPVPASSPTSPLTISELEQTTNNAMTHYMKHLMPPGTKCRIIYGVNVAPAYQGQGVGSALLKWGTDKADQDGVFCWVSSSMGAWPTYAKAGFVEVGRLELTLDDYAQGVKWNVKNDEGEETEQDWGVYIWRWMKRDPKLE
ncbi:hypothetical protein BGX21_010228 [Mortierella sp. AD011]|nr:hypothetical protein BGX20_002240 [Mortierella sp. AD010]KAF9394775.1 hypothetical protein BGX21_010228 [Mortierella sp. AD011]